ncbi:MAG: hypothetical protein Q4C95_06855 [Planctomycetia bacterium]|nr:hypothetical protein [Planctomycetia bacterium]
MVIFLENIWIWLFAGLILFGMGGIVFYSNNHLKTLILFVGSGIIIIAIGFVLVLGVQTDRKAVRTTIFNIANAIEQNDLKSVLSSIDSDATLTRNRVVFFMNHAQIKKTKIRELKTVYINNFTSPPIAIVSFWGTVNGKTIPDKLPFSVTVRFIEVELIKDENNQWLITNQWSFVHPESNYEENGY